MISRKALLRESALYQISDIFNQYALELAAEAELDHELDQNPASCNALLLYKQPLYNGEIWRRIGRRVWVRGPDIFK